MFFSLKGEGDREDEEGDKKGEGTMRKVGGGGELTGMKGRWGGGRGDGRERKLGSGTKGGWREGQLLCSGEN